MGRRMSRDERDLRKDARLYGRLALHAIRNAITWAGWARVMAGQAPPIYRSDHAHDEAEEARAASLARQAGHAARASQEARTR